MQSTKPHAVLLASPGMGHQIPILELGRKLVDHHNFEATIFVIGDDSDLILRSPDENNLRIVSLLPVDLSPLIDVDSAPLAAKVGLTMILSVPNLRAAVSAMKIRPTVLIVDLFGTEALSVTNEFNMLKYVFMTTGAWFLAVMLHTPFLDLTAKDDHVINHEPLRIPGCEPVRYEDTIEIFDQDPTGVAFAAVQGMARNMLTADGILVNSFEDLEVKTFKALRDVEIFGGSGLIPVRPVGPLVRGSESTVDEKNRLLFGWLDSQPPKSVVYVSFGSGGTLSGRQTDELALGLELSQQRFAWVVRPPADNSDSSYFDVGAQKADDTIIKYLPDGFVDRTKKIGQLVQNWGPQIDILKHPSIGSFISHVGWNSTLESIVNGVPIIAWPLYSEQKMNAAALTEHIEVAVRLRPLSDGVITREEISEAVRRVMVYDEGKSIRTKMDNFKKIVKKVLSNDGSSNISLSNFADECKIKLHKTHGA